jgi:exonuclease VII large subunit
MPLSESFDPDAFRDDRLPFQQPWVSGNSLPPVAPEHTSDETEVSPPYLHWQEHLLPLSCVSQEDNLTVLRLELESAHQLLQYQQASIDTLSEQLTNRELALQHTQDELSAVQNSAHHQTSQLTELGAICRDLKMQLRRQQQRVLQYRDLLKTASAEADVPPAVAPSFSDSTVAFGYDSISIETHARTTHARTAASKSLPVSAWSAPESIDLTGPLACYRELATIRMTTARIRLEAKSSRSPQQNIPAPLPPTLSTSVESKDSAVAAAAIRVELPSFTKSAS